MNLITDTLRQIVRRKLWPVALLLVGALVAVPFVLAKNPEPPVVAAGPTHGSKDDTALATFVSAGEETTTRRRTLGQLKDPFEPKALPKAKKAKKSKKTDAAATPTPSATDPSAGSGGGATAPIGPAPTATPAPTITVPAYSLKLRFGSSDAELPAATTIERLSVLPDDENPLVVYRGVEKGGKIAVFELTGGIDAQGDGVCAPTPENCQYVRLHAGETEFFTVPAASDKDGTTADDTTTDDTAGELQFQLDLVKIYKQATKEKAKDATAATTSLAKAASTALSSKAFPLRRRNRYVFDATTGTLHKAAKGQKTPLSSL